MGNPHPIDVHIGNRLRQRRSFVGMSQTALGAAIGLSFQQIQKYERGVNRIGATQLFEVARVLDVPVSFSSRTRAPCRSSRAPGKPCCRWTTVRRSTWSATSSGSAIVGSD